MSVIRFRPGDLVHELGAAVPVPAPIDSPVSQIRSQSFTSAVTPKTRVGLWECSPGRWRRQVLQAEFCHFLEGDCTFIPDEGEAIDIGAGDAVYFPRRSTGVWHVRSLARKIFVVFDEDTAS